VVNLIDQVGAVWQPQIWKFIRVTAMLDYQTFGMESTNNAQTVWVNTACRIDHSQKYLSKLILCIAKYITN